MCYYFISNIVQNQANENIVIYVNCFDDFLVFKDVELSLELVS